jgi:phage tail protein X
MRVQAVQGDTVDLLCWRHLGSTTAVTEQVLAENQGIADIGSVLPVGTWVTLPDAKQKSAPVARKTVQLWE